MGWRDEAVQRADSQACIDGKCTCYPACKVQLARVTEFVAAVTQPVPPKTLRLQIPEKPIAGHMWLCAACSKEQPGPGAHCGYRIILVEKSGIERDSEGRILKATAAQQLDLYRKCHIPEGWNPGDKRR